MVWRTMNTGKVGFTWQMSKFPGNRTDRWSFMRRKWITGLICVRINSFTNCLKVEVAAIFARVTRLCGRFPATTTWWSGIMTTRWILRTRTAFNIILEEPVRKQGITSPAGCAAPSVPHGIRSINWWTFIMTPGILSIRARIITWMSSWYLKI